jgi:tetratricopeptide (TPR) repeat protein
LAYLRQGNFDQAINDFSKTIELDPGYKFAYFNRGNANYDRAMERDSSGWYSNAIVDYTSALKLDPENAGLYFNRGEARLKNGKFIENYNYGLTILDFSQAIELGYKPLDWAYFKRGLAYTKQGIYEKAIDDFNQAIEFNSDYGEYYDGRGVARCLNGDYEGAIKDFEFYIEWLKMNDDYEGPGNNRETWIVELKAGRNPITQEMLVTLWDE